MKRTIVILAKSCKKGDYCIAGKDIETLEWIRPICQYTTEGEIPISIRYQCGSQIEVFDIAEIEFLGPCPTLAQPENHYYDSSIKWIKKGFINPATDLSRYLDTPSHVFYNTGRRVDENILNASPSLYTIQVESLFAIKYINYFSGKDKYEGKFSYNGNDYLDFGFSDPIYRGILTSGAGYKLLSESIITVSLCEPFRGFSYKMIANVLY